MADAPDLILRLPDGAIAYTDAGHGPLVVMVPGLGDIKEEYRFLLPKVLAAGYRVVTMDIRGHGNSSVGWPDHSSAALGSDVVALVRHLHAGPATVIGTSMGAGAAAWAAAESPGDIGRLILIGPFVRDVPPASWWQGQMTKAMIKVSFAGPWATAAWGAYYASLYPSAKPADFDAYKARLLANLAEPGRMAATKAMANAPKTDVAARLAEVRAPTLVVMGSKDPDFPDPAKEAALVATLLRGGSTMIEGAGHYPHAEMPAKTTPVILDFLAA
jgi:pimeloyl-ACP methyl ester carboxylesterase